MTASDFPQVLAEKKLAKARLGRHFADPGLPLIAFCGRASAQKLELLFQEWTHRPVLDHILDNPGLNLLVQAQGESRYESLLLLSSWSPLPGPLAWEELRRLPKRGNYHCRLEFDRSLADQLLLGADFLLMPSSFEPCGITQLEAMARATIPIVTSRGGLADTVIPYQGSLGNGPTGFVIEGASRFALLGGIIAGVDCAANLFRSNPAHMQALRRNAWNSRFTWTSAARAYEEKAYRKALEAAGRRRPK